MQSKQTERLGKRIRRAREKRDRRGKLTIWRIVCLSVKPAILKADGSPDTGLAYKIAYDGYEPDREIQRRLGLREVCVKCHRSFRKPSSQAKPIKSKARVWWDGLKREKQDQILERLFKMEGML